MKRCNNCGWFNLDSATRCKKCDEESFEIAEVYSEAAEQEPEIAAILKEESKTEEPAPVVEPEPAPVVVPEPVPAPAPAKPMMATVAFGAGNHVAQPRKNLAATVMDASAVLADEAPSQCPKCNYPVSGYVEYCPNCGATIRHSVKTTVPENRVEDKPEEKAVNESLASTVMLNEPMSAKPHKPAVTIKESALKATVRDIPVGMIKEDDSADIFRLVPVGGLGEAPIELKIGEIVTIAGRRYTFQK